MDDKPLVSIIITTCKRDTEVLERAIKSAVGQRYENTEIIIINDYPPYAERIERLLREYPEIRLISNDDQSGACVSRNRGIDAAKGEYVALLDDDDEWDDKKIEKMVAAVDENTVLVYCDIAAMKEGEELKSDPDRLYPEGHVSGELLGTNFVGGCSVPLFRREKALEIGGFDESFKSCQDLDFWIRLSKKGEFKAVKEKLVRYTVGSESITGNMERRIQGWERILSKYETEYEECPKSKKKLTSTIVRESAKRGSLKVALKEWRKYGNTAELLKGFAMKMLRVY